MPLSGFHENSLPDRRRHLAYQLRSESDQYNMELKCKLQNCRDDRLNNQKEQLFTFKMNREEQRRELAEQKRNQQRVSNCSEVRPYLRQQLLEESKRSQLMQIEEKRKFQQEMEDRENAWVSVQNAVIRQKNEIRESECNSRRRNESCILETLQEQILDKKANEERKKQTAIDERIRTELLLKESTAQESGERKARQKILDRELKTQLHIAQINQQMLEQQELNFNKDLNKYILEEFRKENLNTAETRARLKNEAVQFLEYTKNVKRQRKIDDEKRNVLIERMRLNTECQKYNQQQVLRLHKKELAQKTYAEIQQQICERNRKRFEQKQQKYIEDQIEQNKYQKLMAQYEEKELNKKRLSMEYGKDLLNQANHIRMQKNLARQYEKEFIGNIENEQDECVEIVKNHVSREVNFLPPHPNTFFMKNT